jgi:hypothetical protein
MSCPPEGPEKKPSYRRGARSALAAYIAAVYPAGPDPIITTFCFSIFSPYLCKITENISFYPEVQEFSWNLIAQAVNFQHEKY